MAFWIFWKKSHKYCKPLCYITVGWLRPRERESCSLAVFICLNGCKIVVVWLKRTFYYHQMICSSPCTHDFAVVILMHVMYYNVYANAYIINDLT